MLRVKKRGQTWSFDLIVAVILFIIVVALFYTFLSGEQSKDKVQGLEAGANNIDASLNCDISSDNGVCIINKGTVSQAKVNTLAASTYNNLKKKLGVSGDFCVYLRDAKTGAIIPMDGKSGVGKDTLLLVNASGNEIFCGQNLP